MMSTGQVYEWLAENIRNRNPFALLRYGDGEGAFCRYCMQPENPFYNRACLKHWGEVPIRKHRQAIADNIVFSYRNANIVGLPNDDWGGKWKEAYEYFGALVPKKKVCSINIHIDLYESGFLDELLKGQEVFYVSCRDIDKLLLTRYKVHSASQLPISAQYKFENRKPVIPFYQQLKNIEHNIKMASLEGKICLLGAGVAGKHLGILMRDRGGMVIDMGSVFDLWKGVESRSWIKDISSGV